MGPLRFEALTPTELSDELLQILKPKGVQGGVVIVPRHLKVEDAPAHVAGGVAELFDRILHQDPQCIVHRAHRRLCVHGRFPDAAFYLEVFLLHNRRLHLHLRPDNAYCIGDIDIGGNVRWVLEKPFQFLPEPFVQGRKI